MSGRIRRRLAVGAAVTGAICLVVVIAGYAVNRWLEDSRPVLSKDIVVGTWRGAGGGELSISDDGTFRAPQVPTSLLESARSTPATTSGSGRWRLAAALNDSSGRETQVALTFDILHNYPVPYSVNVRSDSVDGKVVLFWFIGDPDVGRRFVLERS
jgi:hypothetical protein